MDKDSPEYKKAKRLADKKYKKDGAYKSMFISKTYHELKGTRAKRSKTGLSRWIDEKWIQVIPYLDGKIVKCGSYSDTYACRPLKRITSLTPITVDELIKLHGKEKLRKIAKLKDKNKEGRLDWVKGTIHP